MFSDGNRSAAELCPRWTLYALGLGKGPRSLYMCKGWIRNERIQRIYHWNRVPEPGGFSFTDGRCVHWENIVVCVGAGGGWRTGGGAIRRLWLYLHTSVIALKLPFSLSAFRSSAMAAPSSGIVWSVWVHLDSVSDQTGPDALYKSRCMQADNWRRRCLRSRPN